ncbi:MAG: efflux transporter outer membrane subunit [Burkholderiaceae bacterium]
MASCSPQPCLAALALAGCTVVGPDYRRPDQALPERFVDVMPTDVAGGRAGTALPADWWTLYRDPALDALVGAVLARNPDVRLAIAQVEEAEAGAARGLRSARAAGRPRRVHHPLADHVAGRNAVPPSVPLARSDQRIALSTAFELDLWGKLRRGAEAVDAQLAASRYARDVVALSLAGTTAQSWFALRSLDAQIAVTRESVQTRTESLEVVRARARGGVVSDLDVNQAEAARAEAALQLIELQRQRAAVERQLGALTGQPGLRVPAGDLRAMPVPPLPPAGLPSTLLDRRPDIRQAEAALQAANARIGVARAAMLPTISLTGAFGGQSAELSDLLRSGARIWSLGFGLTLPIFDAGRLQARAEQAEARQRQALAGYQKSIETAFREVGDALTNSERARRPKATCRRGSTRPATARDWRARATSPVTRATSSCSTRCARRTTPSWR